MISLRVCTAFSEVVRSTQQRAVKLPSPPVATLSGVCTFNSRFLPDFDSLIGG